MSDRILKLTDTIISLYVVEKKSIRHIADIVNVNIKTVRRVLKRNNIEIKGSKKNLIGNVYEKLVVIKYVRNDNNGKCIWECQCQCGNKTEARGSDLISGKIKSCGCYRSYIGGENIKISHKKYPKSYGFKGIGDLPGGYLSQIKHRAYIRNLEYSVTKEYLWDLYLKQNKKCALSGLDIFFGIFGKGKRGGTRNQTASLDRID